MSPASRLTVEPQRSPAAGHGAIRRQRRHRRQWFRWVAVLPLLGWMALFGLYPLGQLVRMAFSRVTLRNGEFLWSFAGVSNFIQEFHDSVWGIALKNNAIFIGAGIIGTLALGLLLALLVDSAKILRRVGRNILLWPAVIAPVAVSVIWWLILTPQFGLLNKILITLGLPVQAWLGSGPTALAVVIGVDIWHWTPLVFLIVYANLQGIDPVLYEAARVDGATKFQVVRWISVPLLTPTLLVVAGIRLIMGVKVFDELYVLTHGGPGISTTVISLYVDDVFFGNTELGYGAALGITVVAGLALVLLAARVCAGAVHRIRGARS